MQKLHFKYFTCQWIWNQKLHVLLMTVPALLKNLVCHCHRSTIHEYWRPILSTSYFIDQSPSPVWIFRLADSIVTWNITGKCVYSCWLCYWWNKIRQMLLVKSCLLWAPIADSVCQYRAWTTNVPGGWNSHVDQSPMVFRKLCIIAVARTELHMEIGQSELSASVKSSRFGPDS